jgi:hypothetical protein
MNFISYVPPPPHTKEHSVYTGQETRVASEELEMMAKRKSFALARNQTMMLCFPA